MKLSGIELWTERIIYMIVWEILLWIFFFKTLNFFKSSCRWKNTLEFRAFLIKIKIFIFSKNLIFLFIFIIITCSLHSAHLLSIHIFLLMFEGYYFFKSISSNNRIFLHFGGWYPIFIPHQIYGMLIGSIILNFL